jgi:hypothetical protein
VPNELAAAPKHVTLNQIFAGMIVARTELSLAPMKAQR